MYLPVLALVLTLDLALETVGNLVSIKDQYIRSTDLTTTALQPLHLPVFRPGSGALVWSSMQARPSSPMSTLSTTLPTAIPFDKVQHYNNENYDTNRNLLHLGTRVLPITPRCAATVSAAFLLCTILYHMWHGPHGGHHQMTNGGFNYRQPPYWS